MKGDVAGARSRRHRRRRLRRARHGDPAAAGGHHRLRDPREGRTTSAAPGATTPTRASPATCRRTCTRSRSRRTRSWTRTLLAAGRRSCDLPRRAVADTFGLRAAHPLRPRGRRGDWDDERAALAVAHGRGDAHRARRSSRRPAPLSRAGAARHPGPRRASRARRFHSARWDHDYDLAGKRVAVDRHRRLGDPVRPAIQPRVGALTSSSARRRGSSRAATARITRASRRLLRAAPGAAARSARRIYWRARARRARASLDPQHARARRARWRAPTSRARSPTPRCARSSRPTTRSAASASCSPTTTTRRSRSRTSRSSPTAIAEITRARRDRTADGTRARGRHDHLRHRLPRTELPSRRCTCAAATAACSPTPGTAAPRAYLGTTVPGFPNLFLSSARTPGSATTRSST